MTITDFGMSRLVAQESGSVTQSAVGPLKWMAPENVFDRAYSEKSDGRPLRLQHYLTN